MTTITAMEVESKLRAAAVTALHLSSATEAAGRSKIGGHPDLPKGFVWPLWKGLPMSFLAQIDLSSVSGESSLTGLPKSGLLSFFYDSQQSTWGFSPEDRGSWSVCYFESDTYLSETEPPVLKGENFIFEEQPISLRPIKSYPSIERVEAKLSLVEDGAFELEDKLAAEEKTGPTLHQFGGFPSAIQGDEMELEAEMVSNGINCGTPEGYKDPRFNELQKSSKEWKLLLQLDSDDDAGMMWGDSGRLYFFIRANDLAKQDFSNVWMVLQCF